MERWHLSTVVVSLSCKQGFACDGQHQHRVQLDGEGFERADEPLGVSARTGCGHWPGLIERAVCRATRHQASDPETSHADVNLQSQSHAPA